jgi:hypothetical protein
MLLNSINKYYFNLKSLKNLNLVISRTNDPRTSTEG